MFRLPQEYVQPCWVKCIKLDKEKKKEKRPKKRTYGVKLAGTPLASSISSFAARWAAVILPKHCKLFISTDTYMTHLVFFPCLPLPFVAAFFNCCGSTVTSLSSSSSLLVVFDRLAITSSAFDWFLFRPRRPLIKSIGAGDWQGYLWGIRKLRAD